MSLPPNWDLGYDDAVEKWFYMHKPTGAKQFTFPKLGDELNSSTQPSATQPQPQRGGERSAQNVGREQQHPIGANPPYTAPQEASAPALHSSQPSQQPQQQWPSGIPGASPTTPSAVGPGTYPPANPTPAAAHLSQQPISQQSWHHSVSPPPGDTQSPSQQIHMQQLPNNGPPSSQQSYYQAEQPQRRPSQTTNPSSPSQQVFQTHPQQQVYQQQGPQHGYPTPAATPQTNQQPQLPTPLLASGNVPSTPTYQQQSGALDQNVQPAAQQQQRQLQAVNVPLAHQILQQPYQQPGYPMQASNQQQTSAQRPQSVQYQQHTPVQPAQPVQYQQQPLTQSQPQLQYPQLPAPSVGGNAPQYYGQLPPQNAGMQPQQQLQQPVQCQPVPQGQYVQQPIMAAPVAPYQGQARVADPGTTSGYYTARPQGVQPQVFATGPQQASPTYQQQPMQKPVGAPAPAQAYPSPSPYNQVQVPPFQQQQQYQQRPVPTAAQPPNRNLIAGAVAGVVGGGLLLAKGLQKAVQPNQQVRPGRPMRPMGRPVTYQTPHHPQQQQQQGGDGGVVFHQDPTQQQQQQFSYDPTQDSTQQQQYSYDPTQDPTQQQYYYDPTLGLTQQQSDLSSGGDLSGGGDGGGVFSSLLQSFTGGGSNDPTNNAGYVDTSGDYMGMLMEQQAQQSMLDQDITQSISDVFSAI